VKNTTVVTMPAISASSARKRSKNPGILCEIRPAHVWLPHASPSRPR
jgi:hypothetical protein